MEVHNAIIENRLAHLSKRIDALEKENAELKAQNNELIECLTDVEKVYSCGEHAIEEHKWQRVYDLINKTPQQSLNEIQAQAIEEATNKAGFLMYGSEQGLALHKHYCDYAKKLRKGSEE